jgi:hypothetical protein
VKPLSTSGSAESYRQGPSRGNDPLIARFPARTDSRATPACTSSPDAARAVPAQKHRPPSVSSCPRFLSWIVGASRITFPFHVKRSRAAWYTPIRACRWGERDPRGARAATSFHVKHRSYVILFEAVCAGWTRRSHQSLSLDSGECGGGRGLTVGVPAALARPHPQPRARSCRIERTGRPTSRSASYSRLADHLPFPRRGQAVGRVANVLCTLLPHHRCAAQGDDRNPLTPDIERVIRALEDVRVRHHTTAANPRPTSV